MNRQQKISIAGLNCRAGFATAEDEGEIEDSDEERQNLGDNKNNINHNRDE